MYKSETSELPIFLQVHKFGVSKKTKSIKVQFSDTIHLSNVIELPLSAEKLIQLHAIVRITSCKALPVEEEDSSSRFEKYDKSSC